MARLDDLEVVGDWWPNPPDAEVLVVSAIWRLNRSLSLPVGERVLVAELGARLCPGGPARVAGAVGRRVLLAAEWYGTAATGRATRIERRNGRVRIVADWDVLAPEPRRAAQRELRRRWAIHGPAILAGAARPSKEDGQP